MDASFVLSILERSGALIRNDHFVYNSGRHGPDYISKERLFAKPYLLMQVANGIARQFMDQFAENEHPVVDVVCGPAIGGALIELLTVLQLIPLLGNTELQGVFCEKSERSLLKIATGDFAKYGVDLQGEWFDNRTVILSDGDELLVRQSALTLKRGMRAEVENKRVLVVDDVVHTGLALGQTINCVRSNGGIVIGAVGLCLRGKVTAESLGIPFFSCLCEIDLPTYTEEECPECKSGKPVNETLGKGKAFMDRQRETKNA